MSASLVSLFFLRLTHSTSDLGIDQGPWSAEEEEELTRIVEEMTVKQGGTLDDDLFWGAVSNHMGNKRNRQQCRIKWYVVSLTHSNLD